MSTPLRASDQDLRALAAIVSQDRPDLPDGEGLLPPSLLADLMGQIRCDAVLSLERYDTGRQVHRWLQGDEEDEDDDARAVRGLESAVLDPLLGLPGLQPSGPHRRPARRRQDL